MIHHPYRYLEQLASTEVDLLIEQALSVLENVGLAIQSDAACRALAQAGAAVDIYQNVRIPAAIARQLLAAAPSRWTWHARNPRRSVEVGGDRLLVAPGYGSPFVADLTGKRRPATLDDLRRFARLANQSEAMDVVGGLIVEPTDVPVEQRPAAVTQTLLTCSDKPIMGSVAGAEGARQSIDMARQAFGGTFPGPSIVGLININSPLRLDGRMAEAMLEYARIGQPILFTPGIMMGMTAPVTVAGALVQAFAELIGCVALAQALLPAAGVPVMIGLGGFGADLKTAGPGFGRPENALAIIHGAQIARRLRLPFRCSAAVTGAMGPDCRSGYERMMTALSAFNAGAHFALQGAGILDCINSMCYEQFVIDLEIWGYIRRLSQRPVLDAEHLAVEQIAGRPQDYLGLDHTLDHHREQLHTPQLDSDGSYDAWQQAGAPDVVRRTRKYLATW